MDGREMRRSRGVQLDRQCRHRSRQKISGEKIDKNPQFRFVGRAKSSVSTGPSAVGFLRPHPIVAHGGCITYRAVEQGAPVTAFSVIEGFTDLRLTYPTGLSAGLSPELAAIGSGW
jgi:hypothetical protein